MAKPMVHSAGLGSGRKQHGGRTTASARVSCGREEPESGEGVRGSFCGEENRMATAPNAYPSSGARLLDSTSTGGACLLHHERLAEAFTKKPLESFLNISKQALYHSKLRENTCIQGLFAMKTFGKFYI